MVATYAHVQKCALKGFKLLSRWVQLSGHAKITNLDLAIWIDEDVGRLVNEKKKGERAWVKIQWSKFKDWKMVEEQKEKPWDLCGWICSSADVAAPRWSGMRFQREHPPGSSPQACTHPPEIHSPCTQVASGYCCHGGMPRRSALYLDRTIHDRELWSPVWSRWA